MNVRLRLAAGMAVAVLVLVIAATGAGAIMAAENSDDHVRRTLTSIAQLDRVFETLLNAETGQRGYLLTRDPAFLDPLNRAKNDLEPGLQSLERLAEGPALTAIGRLASASRIYMAQVKASIATAETSGNDAAVALAKQGAWKNAMDDLRGQIGAIRRAAETALAIQTRHDRGKLRFGLYIILGGSSLGFFFSLFVSLSIGRVFTEKEIVRRLLAVAAGELESKAAALIVTAEEKESVRRLLAVTAEELNVKAGALIVTADEKESVRRLLGVTAEELRVKAEALIITAEEKESVRRLLVVTAEELRLKAAALVVTAEEKESVRRLLVVTAEELRLKAEALIITAEEKESVRRELVVTAEEKESVRRQLVVTAEQLRLKAAALVVTAEEQESVRRELAATAEEKENVRRLLVITAEELRLKAEDLSEHQRELGQLLLAEKQLSARLNTANQELDQFAYATSHDLKTPLRGIMNLTGWIEEDLGAMADPKVKANLSLIHNRAKRLEALIDGILAYARAGRLLAKPELLDTRSLLNDIAELLDPPSNVVIELVDPLPCFLAERVPLQQIFMNLIQNAIKHGCRDGGCVKVSSLEEGSFYRFSINDSGPGIAPEYHKRVFEIFETLVTRDKVEGSGIGLSVVKKLVETRGGAVTLSSIPGQGATFSFTWPKVPLTIDLAP